MMSRWKPSSALQASAALHLGAVAGIATGLPLTWAAGAIVTNHALLSVAGLWPRSTVLGSNMLRLSQAACEANQIAITIDDGPNPEVTPAVLDILDASNAKASFFCIGRLVESHPYLAQEIIRRGHSIENHSYGHHHHFSLMGMKSLRQQIVKTQEIISQTTGYMPAYFRAPAGLRSPLLDPVLQSLDLKLVSWTRRGFDTITNEPSKILNKLQRGLTAGDILLLHDGNCALTKNSQPVVIPVLSKLLDTLKSMGLRPVSLNCAA
jgi:peptidoglycan/xylan/chitin deacetylase (PgdA/CDA1 family)